MRQDKERYRDHSIEYTEVENGWNVCIIGDFSAKEEHIAVTFVDFNAAHEYAILYIDGKKMFYRFLYEEIAQQFTSSHQLHRDCDIPTHE
jgi:hypothetical protein